MSVRNNGWTNFPLTLDYFGVGSSTMAGSGAGTGANTVAPLRVLASELTSGGIFYNNATTPPGSGSPMVSNKGTAGTNSTTIATSVTSAIARQKAANTLIQLGGNWGGGFAVDTVVTDAATIVGASGLNHGNYVFVNKHADFASPSGTADWQRQRSLIRKLITTYGQGRVDDLMVMFRHLPPRDGGDARVQQTDRCLPSYQWDNAHANLDGNRIIARRSYGRALLAWEGYAPFVPHQRMVSTVSTNQTNGGIVGTIGHLNNVANTLTGATFGWDLTVAEGRFAAQHFSVAVETGAIVLRRATGTTLLQPKISLPLLVTKGVYSYTTWIEAYLCTAVPDGTYGCRINQNWLVREDPITGANNAATGVSMAIGIRVPNSTTTGDGPANDGATRQFLLMANGNFTVQLKATNVFGFLARDSSSVTRISMDSSTTTAQRFTENISGIRWVFFSGDAVTTANCKVAVDAFAATTAGTLSAGTLQLDGAAANIMQRLGSSLSSETGGSWLNLEIFAMIRWPAYIDFGPTTGGFRDQVRDSTTFKSKLGAVNGVINGIAPDLWFEGPAANWAAGLNLADNTSYGRWDMTDRIPLATVVA